MIRSMTGFGAAAGSIGGVSISVELRSVNHRFFNPGIKLPPSLAPWESNARDALRRRVARGHVTLSVRVDRASQAGTAIDEAAFAAGAAALAALQQRHNLGGVVDVATVLRLPDVVRSAAPEDESSGTPEEFIAIVEAAANALSQSRDEEGARLAAILSERIGLLAATLGRIAGRAPERIAAHRDRLRENVQHLLDGRPADEQRIAQEIALLAERLDIGEEVDRFSAHLAAFRKTLADGGEGGVGKRLGFLLQELLREANTIGSKSYDAGLQAEVVLLKEELERIREQVENIE